MNILQILPKLESGGVERGTLEIAKAIVKEGYGSFVASAGGKMVRTLVLEDSKHIKIPLDTKNPFLILLNAYRLVQVIKKHNIQIVHARSRAPAWSGLIAARCTKTKFITTFHGIYGYHLWPKRYYNSVMLRGCKVIAVSHFVANHIKQVYGECIDESNIAVVPRGICTNVFNRNKISATRIKNAKQHLGSKNLSDENCNILLPGRITRGKGHLYLLDVLHQLPSKKWRCFIVGHCSADHAAYLQEIKDKAKKLGLHHNIYYADDWGDMPALYSVFDVVISAALIPEAFGRTIVEAQAMGAIVIATGHGGAQETIKHGINGFHIPIKNPKAAANIMLHIMGLTTAQRQDIMQEAINNAANYSLSSMQHRTIAVYRSVM